MREDKGQYTRIYEIKDATHHIHLDNPDLIVKYLIFELQGITGAKIDILPVEINSVNPLDVS